MKVVVIGSGVGGQLVSYGIKEKFSNYDVILVGPDVSSKESAGLFYFNRKIPNICDREIRVSYDLIGDGTLENYQIKSKGFSDSTLTTSSFNNIGETVSGYILTKNLTRSDITRYKDFVKFIDLNGRSIILGDDTKISYDYLISTIPLNVFINVCNHGGRSYRSEFKYRPVYQFTAGKVDRGRVSSIKVKYDLTDSIFYRHSTYLDGHEEVLWMSSESIVDFANETSVMSPGKIVPSEILSKYVAEVEGRYSNVKLCGRYARWDYHYTVDQSYYDSIEFIKSRKR